MKAHPVSIALAYDGRHTTVWNEKDEPIGGVRVAHILVVDADGNVHERMSDQAPGHWSTWPRDLLPNRKQRRNRKTRKK